MNPTFWESTAFLFLSSSERAQSRVSKPPEADFRWKDWIAPRYWLTWAGLGLLWLVTRLPVNAVLAIGRWMGPLAMRLIPGRDEVVSRNLALALPHENHPELTRHAHQHAGMAALETGWLWFRGPSAFSERFRMAGTEHLDRAVATGRGVILLQAHFTLIDLCSSFVCERWPVSAVYDPAKNPLFSILQVRFRLRTLSAMIPNRDIRNMVRRLKRGEIVWFSPDQAVSARHGGIPTRYFGQAVLTSGGTARIVAMTNAIVIPMIPTRSDDGKHYSVQFEPPLELDTSDITAATQVVNDHLESQVRRQPEQYLWAHKRFKPPSADLPSPYAGIR